MSKGKNNQKRKCPVCGSENTSYVRNSKGKIKRNFLTSQKIIKCQDCGHKGTVSKPLDGKVLLRGLAYVYGAFFIAKALLFLVHGGIIYGLGYLIAGGLIFPETVRLMEEKLNIHLSGGIRLLIVFIIMMFFTE